MDQPKVNSTEKAAYQRFEDLTLRLLWVRKEEVLEEAKRGAPAQK